MLRGHFLSSPRPRNGRREGRRPRFLPSSPRRPPKRRSTREVYGAGWGGAGTESPWQRLARHAPRCWDRQPKPRPWQSGPLSGNAKPEAWLPDLRRYSLGSRPACGCLAKRRDTAPPAPGGHSLGASLRGPSQTRHGERLTLGRTLLPWQSSAHRYPLVLDRAQPLGLLQLADIWLPGQEVHSYILNPGSIACPGETFKLNFVAKFAPCNAALSAYFSCLESLTLPS